jgi:putative restriction endonuclease
VFFGRVVPPKVTPHPSDGPPIQMLQCERDDLPTSDPTSKGAAVAPGGLEVNDTSRDSLLRAAAFDHVRRLSELHGALSAPELAPGFTFNRTRVPLFNPRRGIFKPQQMQFLLSIKTVFPKPGGKVWYDDQREVHRQIFDGDETINYAFMGEDPAAADNRWLRQASEAGVPIIYFLGIAPGRYHAVMPAFVSEVNNKTLSARIAFGLADERNLPPPNTSIERRYALRTVQQRLHQASFREAVINAYDGRCALSGLPEPLLLDAAHIVSDRDEAFGQPLVPNGIPLSKIHHAAFDAHLIGIDADYRLHVSRRLLAQNDGPLLDALKRLNGGTIHLSARVKDRPDRERLSLRFARFKGVA